MVRQLGAFVVAVFIFWAVIAAASRLLTLRESPAYIKNVTNGLSNLFQGAFGR